MEKTAAGDMVMEVAPSNVTRVDRCAKLDMSVARSYLIVGGKGGGKNTIAVNMLRDNKGTYDHVYVFSANQHTRNMYAAAFERGCSVYADFHPHVVRSIIDACGSKPFARRPSVCIVISAPTEMTDNPEYHRALIALLRVGHHAGISTIVTAYSSRDVSLAVRNNPGFGTLLLCSTHSAADVRYARECAVASDAHGFTSMLKHIFATPHRVYGIDLSAQNTTMFWYEYIDTHDMEFFELCNDADSNVEVLDALTVVPTPESLVANHGDAPTASSSSSNASIVDDVNLASILLVYMEKQQALLAEFNRAIRALPSVANK